MKLEVQQEAAATKLQGKVSGDKRKRTEGSDSEGFDTDDGQPKKRVLNTVDKWQKGHRRAALEAARKKVVEQVTVQTWAEAYVMLRDHGWAVVENFTSLFSPESQPNGEQRDYILQGTIGTQHAYFVCSLTASYLPSVPEDCKEVIFEGAQSKDDSAFIGAHHDRISLHARQQLKATQLGPQVPKWKAYKERYGNQLVELIEGFTQYDRPTNIREERSAKKMTRKNAGNSGSSAIQPQGGETPPKIVRQVPGMFTGKAGKAANWKMGFTSIVNGTGYQHPHADCGRPDSLKGLKMFPFVTIHGFGLDRFSMWLLPDPFSNSNKYGFLHTFEASQMLLMRGDFVHAGVPSTVPRGHMKFFPSETAGWKRQSAYWNRKGWEDATFLWQGTYPPFGYPCTSSPDLHGTHVITYPVLECQHVITKLLRYPYTVEECQLLGLAYVPLSAEDRSERTLIKRKAVAQLGHGVYNV